MRPLAHLGGEAALECVGDEVQPAVGVGAVGPVEVLDVGVVEEERRASLDPGYGVQPPPRQAQHPVPVAVRFRRAAAHEDEARRRGSWRRGSRVVLLGEAQHLACRRGDGGGRGGLARHGGVEWRASVGAGAFWLWLLFPVLFRVFFFWLAN